MATLIRPPIAEMVAHLVHVEDALRISWSPTNRAQEAIYLCVRANIDNQVLSIPYTYLANDDRLLVVTLSEFPLPPDIDIYAPDIPFYRRLEPGQTTAEAFELPVPAHELHPYGDRPIPQPPIPISVSTIAFSVACFAASDKIFATPNPVAPDLFKAKGRDTQLLEQRFELQRPIVVMKRTDNFYRPA